MSYLINKKILGLIGLSARARKVLFGSDSVETGIKKNKVKLIIISIEASERTKDKFIKLGKEYNLPVLILGTIEELSKSIGKNNKAIYGFLDENLSNEIQKINNGGEVIG